MVDCRWSAWLPPGACTALMSLPALTSRPMHQSNFRAHCPLLHPLPVRCFLHPPHRQATSPDTSTYHGNPAPIETPILEINVTNW